MKESLKSDFSFQPLQVVNGKCHAIHVFDVDVSGNIDVDVVKSFGEEWNKFKKFSSKDIEVNGMQYFDILHEHVVNRSSYVLDAGCGTGRWSGFLANRVGFIEAVDPSDAIFSADVMLANYDNVRLSKATIENLPFSNETFDFVMSIGVLHHIPDTQSAMRSCVEKLKMEGYFYVYLYYDLSQRGWGFRFLFRIANGIRWCISRMPGKAKHFFCDLIALVFYMPFVWAGRLLSLCGLKRLAAKMPLHFYQNQSFYIIRNDALDRFGTKLEQRFSKKQVIDMMTNAGLSDIIVSDFMPYWHAIGKRKF